MHHVWLFWLLLVLFRSEIPHQTPADISRARDWRELELRDVEAPAARAALCVWLEEPRGAFVRRYILQKKVPGFDGAHRSQDRSPIGVQLLEMNWYWK